MVTEVTAREARNSSLGSQRVVTETFTTNSQRQVGLDGDGRLSISGAQNKLITEFQKKEITDSMCVNKSVDCDSKQSSSKQIEVKEVEGKVTPTRITPSRPSGIGQERIIKSTRDTAVVPPEPVQQKTVGTTGVTGTTTKRTTITHTTNIDGKGNNSTTITNGGGDPNKANSSRDISNTPISKKNTTTSKFAD